MAELPKLRGFRKAAWRGTKFSCFIVKPPPRAQQSDNQRRLVVVILSTAWFRTATPRARMCRAACPRSIESRRPWERIWNITSWATTGKGTVCADLTPKGPSFAALEKRIKNMTASAVGAVDRPGVGAKSGLNRRMFAAWGPAAHDSGVAGRQAQQAGYNIIVSPAQQSGLSEVRSLRCRDLVSLRKIRLYKTTPTPPARSTSKRAVNGRGKSLPRPDAIVQRRLATRTETLRNERGRRL
jgi:hypothetical protein